VYAEDEMLAVKLPTRARYALVLEVVGSRAPWRERTEANVIEHPRGMLGDISEGTLKYGEYWPQKWEISGSQR